MKSNYLSLQWVLVAAVLVVLCTAHEADALTAPRINSGCLEGASGLKTSNLIAEPDAKDSADDGKHHLFIYSAASAKEFSGDVAAVLSLTFMNHEDDTLAACERFANVETVEFHSDPDLGSTKALVSYLQKMSLKSLDISGGVEVSRDVLTQVAKSKRLEELKIDAMGLTAEEILEIGKCPALKSLECGAAMFGECRLGDEVVQTISKIQTLEKLDCWGLKKVTDKGLLALKSLKQLRVVKLAGFPDVTDAGLAFLQSCENLSELELGSMPAVKGTFLNDLKHLESLNINDCSQLNPDPVPSAFSGLKKLTIWNKTGCSDKALLAVLAVGKLEDLCVVNAPWFGDECVQAALVLPTLRKLYLVACSKVSNQAIAQVVVKTKVQSLTFDLPQLNDVAVEAIAQQDSITHLNLWFCEKVTTTAFRKLERLTNLVELGLTGAEQLQTEDLAVLVQKMPQLGDLSIRQLKVGPALFAVLGKLQHLKTLDLGFAKVEAKDLERISECKALRDLDIGGCPVDDDLIKKLSGLPLSRLQIYGCEKLTDKGLKALESMLTLRDLDINDCAGITSNGATSLRRKLPHCAIRYFDPR